MATMREQNTIILEMDKAKKDDVIDLRYGEGRLFNKIARVLEQMKEAGEIGDNAQPIIVITKKKKDKDW